MIPFQYWLYKFLGGITLVKPFMTSAWGWPIIETIHFIGLSLLIGAIGMFDLRLLGVGKRIPIGALHRLIPWGICGYLINILTGSMFLVTAPDQYIYNSAFHFKILFMGLAGLNVLAFYTTMFRKVRVLGPGEDAPAFAKFIGGASLFLWTGVIVFGRLLTFYRPYQCDGVPAFLANCFQ
jgi:hypothetical protein